MTIMRMSARLALTSLALTVAGGCADSHVPMDAAGPASDAAGPVSDAAGPASDVPTGDAFDPSITYPGEGEPCEFSLFCGERQMCVDGECARHERFEADDLVLGEAVRIPHELFRTSSLYTEARRDWDNRTYGLTLYGQMLPGPSGPTLAFFEGFPCQVAIYGEGPPRVVYVRGIHCATVGVSPDGYVLLGGMNFERLNRYGKWALVAPDGELVAEGDYGAFESRVQEAIGNPDVRLYSMTSILWHEDRFLFSASASPPSDVRGATLELGGPKHPTHSFFGSISLDGEVELREAAGAFVHEGSFGWIVRDEGGLRSILTVFDALIEPTDMRIDVLSWETGERETIADGAAAEIAGTSRYFQPSSNEWTLTVLKTRSNCAQELFAGTAHTASLWDLPPEQCPEWPPRRLTHQNLLGSASATGAAFSGNPLVPWMTGPYRRPDMVLVVRAIDREEVLVLDEPAPGVDTFRSIQAVSRFGMTLEVFASARNVGDEGLRLSYWEFPLSRSTA